MGMEELFKQAMGQGLWAVLFVWLLYETRRESGKREDKLYEQIQKYDEKLDKQGQALIQITETLTNISRELQEIKCKFDD